MSLEILANHCQTLLRYSIDWLSSFEKQAKSHEHVNKVHPAEFIVERFLSDCEDLFEVGDFNGPCKYEVFSDLIHLYDLVKNFDENIATAIHLVDIPYLHKDLKWRQIQCQARLVSEQLTTFIQEVRNQYDK